MDNTKLLTKVAKMAKPKYITGAKLDALRKIYHDGNKYYRVATDTHVIVKIADSDSSDNQNYLIDVPTNDKLADSLAVPNFDRLLTGLEHQTFAPVETKVVKTHLAPIRAYAKAIKPDDGGLKLVTFNWHDSQLDVLAEKAGTVLYSLALVQPVATLTSHFTTKNALFFLEAIADLQRQNQMATIAQSATLAPAVIVTSQATIAVTPVRTTN